MMETVKCPYCSRDNTIDCRATQEIILVCVHCDNTFAAFFEVSIDITTSKVCGVNGIDHKLIAAVAYAWNMELPGGVGRFNDLSLVCQMMTKGE